MDAIAVRPLASGEDDLWFAAGPPAQADDEDEIDARRQLASRSEHDERCFLIAVRGEAAIARLRGEFLSSPLYAISEIAAREDRDFDEAAPALVRFLARSFAEDGNEIIRWDRPKSETVNQVLLRSGFVVDRSKRFVERSLEDYRSPYDTAFSYRTLADVGEDEFVAELTESALGDPFEDVTKRDPRSDFQGLVDYAGCKFEPTWWKIACVDGRPVGVVLPQIYADADDVGTLFYVGVKPEHRGRGFGKRLHAAGLAFIAEYGAARYVGSTDTRNLAMIRVLEANGCEQTGTQLFFRAQP